MPDASLWSHTPSREPKTAFYFWVEFCVTGSRLRTAPCAMAQVCALLSRTALPYCFCHTQPMDTASALASSDGKVAPGSYRLLGLKRLNHPLRTTPHSAPHYHTTARCSAYACVHDLHQRNACPCCQHVAAPQAAQTAGAHCKCAQTATRWCCPANYRLLGMRRINPATPHCHTAACCST